MSDVLNPAQAIEAMMGQYLAEAKSAANSALSKFMPDQSSNMSIQSPAQSSFAVSAATGPLESMQQLSEKPAVGPTLLDAMVMEMQHTVAQQIFCPDAASERLVMFGSPYFTADSGYTHQQEQESSTWHIPHEESNLNTRKVIVTLYNEKGMKMQEDSLIVSINGDVGITFTNPVKGTAIITKAEVTPLPFRKIDSSMLSQFTSSSAPSVSQKQEPDKVINGNTGPVNTASVRGRRLPKGAGVDLNRIDLKDRDTAERVLFDKLNAPTLEIEEGSK